MSIATKHGDGGQTGLAGGLRISKADLRVEAYGTVDELNSFMGFARSLCTHAEVSAWTEEIQRTLFRVGGALATAPGATSGAAKNAVTVTAADVDRLTAWVEQVEGIEGVLSDWSLPGAHRESAAYEMARTVCRRAERCAVRFVESGGEAAPEIVAYLNRLSDLLWLMGRWIEFEAGVDARLRDESKSGPKWSRAW